MPTSFRRSLSTLATTKLTPMVLMACVGLVLAGLWMGWLFSARLSIYAVSQRAQVEVMQEAHQVHAEVGGRVATTHLSLGRMVEVGEVLLELDSETLSLQIAEENVRLEAVNQQVVLLREQIAVLEQSLSDQEDALSARMAEAIASHRQSAVSAQFAEEEAARTAKLDEKGVASRAEAAKARSDSQVLKAAASASFSSMQRLQAESRITSNETKLKIVQLRQQVAALVGQAASQQAAIETLKHRIEQRRIRSPIGGRIGELAYLNSGSVLAEGQKIATIVPEGPMKIIADFAPAMALGKIRPGQRARLHLDGFAWTLYGSIELTVAKVGSEAKSGHLQVELVVDQGQQWSAPFEHGQPGTVHVEVESMSPFEYLFDRAESLLRARKL